VLLERNALRFLNLNMIWKLEDNGVDLYSVKLNLFTAVRAVVDVLALVVDCPLYRPNGVRRRQCWDTRSAFGFAVIFPKLFSLVEYAARY
jgi:hypothetical protein